MRVDKAFHGHTMPNDQSLEVNPGVPIRPSCPLTPMVHDFHAMSSDPVTRAFESLSTLPPLEGGFLRQLLLEAIDDPSLATNPALSEHLHLVPRVLRALDPGVIQELHRPGVVAWAGNALEVITLDVALAPDVSAETLAKLCRVALRDVPFLVAFLDHRPVGQFI